MRADDAVDADDADDDADVARAEPGGADGDARPVETGGAPIPPMAADPSFEDEDDRAASSSRRAGGGWFGAVITLAARPEALERGAAGARDAAFAAGLSPRCHPWGGAPERPGHVR